MILQTTLKFFQSHSNKVQVMSLTHEIFYSIILYGKFLHDLIKRFRPFSHIFSTTKFLEKSKPIFPVFIKTWKKLDEFVKSFINYQQNLIRFISSIKYSLVLWIFKSRNFILAHLPGGVLFQTGMCRWTEYFNISTPGPVSIFLKPQLHDRVHTLHYWLCNMWLYASCTSPCMI